MALDTSLVVGGKGSENRRLMISGGQWFLFVVVARLGFFQLAVFPSMSRVVSFNCVSQEIWVQCESIFFAFDWIAAVNIRF